MEALKTNGSGWFLFQRVSGVALAAMLVFHFALMHFTGDFSFASVQLRMQSVVWKTFDISFLILALGHGLYGFWMISCDYFDRDWLRVTVASAVGVGGLVMAVMGVITVALA